MRGCRKALSWEYVVGISVFRVIPILYLSCAKSNIFSYEGDCRVGVGIVAWVTFLIAVMGVQEVAGPRIFIPVHVSSPPHTLSRLSLILRVASTSRI